MHNRSKNSRQRGSKTHGWGSMKKHRGAGHRGGRGAAGSGKRGDAKKPSIWKNTKYAGKYGFSPKNRDNRASITIHYLENHKKTLLKQKIITQNKDEYVADLNKAGFVKLLATGKATSKWNITINSATKLAAEKIKKAKGTITILKSQETGKQNADNKKTDVKKPVEQKKDTEKKDV